MTLTLALLVKKYFFTDNYVPNLINIKKLNLSKQDRRELLVTLRTGFVLYNLIKKKLPKISSKTSGQLACAILMLATQEILFHKQPIYHVGGVLKKTLRQANLLWLEHQGMAFLKTLPSWEEALSLMKTELTTDSIITQLLIEHPTLDIQEFFSHPPLWVRLDLPESIADIDPLLIIKKATPPLKGILLKNTAPEINALFEKGILSYQDIAAQSIDEIAYLIQEPQTIIDCCAAPGGKATSLMSRWPRSSFLLTDVDSIRLNGLSDNITRFQKNVSYNVTLALHNWASSSLQNKTADFVLVDAPCSGTGVIRRHPDILWNKTVKDIKEAAITQRKILENAAIAVKSGGFLLYSTCSLSSIENDDTVHAFLKENPSFDFKKITLSLGHNTKFGAQILPSSLQDGLYYSLLQRVND